MTSSASQREAEARRRGRRALDEGRLDEARGCFEQGTQLLPNRPWSWLWLSRALAKEGEYTGAYAAVKRALEVHPHQPHASLHLAHLLERDGRLEEAVQTISAMCGAHQNDQAALRSGVQRLLRLRATDDVRAVAGWLLARDPQDEVGVAAMATAMAVAGSSAAADNLVAERLDCGTPDARRAAARYYLWRGDAPRAWSVLETMSADESNADVLHQVALGLRRAGELTAARAAFLAAARGRPSSEGDSSWAETVSGDIAVLSGSWRPTLDAPGAVSCVKARVLHCVGKSRPVAQTGYTLRTHFTARSQQELGLDAHVVTQLGFPWDQGVRDHGVENVLEGVPYHHLLPSHGRVPSRPDARLALNVEALAALVRQIRPAVLHAASDFRNAILALEMGRAFKVPVVYEVRGFWEETWLSKQDAASANSEAYRWRRDRELECMRAADAVVTLSEGMKAVIAERGVSTNKVTVVPNAVDVEAFTPVPRDDALAAELGLRYGEIVIGYISSFAAYEGIRYLVEATARLDERGLPVRALLVGDGDEMTALRTLAADLGIGDKVVFTGRVPHRRVQAHYSLIDVFVVPRTDDRVSHLVTPLKPYEAMAMERALVVSGVDALRGMVEEGVTAEVFRPGDVLHLVDVVEGLALDAQRRRELGRQARRWVAAHRTWHRNALRYRQLYESLGAC